MTQRETGQDGVRGRHNFSMRGPRRATALGAWLGAGAFALAAACAGGAAEAPAPSKPAASKPKAQQPTATAPAPAPAAAVPAPPAPAGSAPPAGTAPSASADSSALPAASWAQAPDGSLPPVVEGVDIPRPVLLAVLSAGVGRFLQSVQLEPALARGRFVGWRLVRVFDAAQSGNGGLRPGDTVIRINGQSIERPEQFKNVWDSLATESLLVLQIERGGKHSEIRHRIVQ